MYLLFNFGMLELEDWVKGEWLYWDVVCKAVKFFKMVKFMVDEFQDLENKLYEKYVCNFSVFQLIFDHWVIDQLFLVMFIHCLNEKPMRKVMFVDIICDSDGEVEKFVDLKDIKHVFEVHELKDNEPYYVK